MIYLAKDRLIFNPFCGQMLFDVCDRYDIPRPNVVITEFGWEYQNTAGVEQAMSVDLPWAAELYAAYPEVLGAAITMLTIPPPVKIETFIWTDCGLPNKTPLTMKSK